MANFGFNFQLPDISGDALQDRQAVLAIKNQLYALQEQLRYTFGNLNFADNFGSTVSLGGKNNSSGVLEIKNERGNIMVLLNKKGITMSDGTDIFGAAGLLSSFQYSTGDWQNIGYSYDVSNSSSTVRKGLSFKIEIPENFKVKSARITFYHAIRRIHLMHLNPDDPTGEKVTSLFYCYARNIKLYRATDFWNFRQDFYYQSDASLPATEPVLLEIPEVFGTAGYTPPVPDPNDAETWVVDSIVSENFSDSLQQGMNHLILQTGNELPIVEYGGDIDGFQVDEEQQTGVGIAVINITGYLK